MAALAIAFNTMQVRLKVALSEINGFTQVLEDRVAERTQELEVAQRRLIQNDRLASLGKLAASVAHEINNPVAGILNLSMLMERVLTDDGIPPGRLEEFRAYLRTISEETTRVGRIVSDLLAFSRQPSLLWTEADLNAIVKQTVALVGHQLDLAGVRLELRLAPDLPVVPCDASQVQQVVINMLMNASEATAPGGRVEAETSLAQDSVVLMVRDSGVGIPESNLDRIYEPFFTTKEEGKGVGLGLAVVYGIVQAHGGSIEAKSTPGRGTEFVTAFPLKAAPTAAGAAE